MKFKEGDKVIYKETTPNLAYRGMIAIVVQSTPLLIQLVNPDKNEHNMNSYPPSPENLRLATKLDKVLK